MVPRREEIEGQRFGNWLVLTFEGMTPGRNARYLCRCVCGVEKVVLRMSLVNGDSTSCGCHGKELRRTVATKHQGCVNGLKSPEYQAWQDMLARCERPNHPKFRIYGERGIRVCKRWRESFADFLSDVGKRPSPNHSLDRYPDNDGNYEPGNCRWAIPKEQARNRRTTKLLTLQGETLPLATWAERLGMSRITLQQRVYILGWSDEKALTTPVKKQAWRERRRTQAA